MSVCNEALQMNGVSSPNIEQTALDHALLVLSPEVRQSIRVYFEYMHRISLNQNHSLTKAQVEIVLRHFFDDGANVIIGKFNEKLNELNAIA
jgi:hypothetical protein